MKKSLLCLITLMLFAFIVSASTSANSTDLLTKNVHVKSIALNLGDITNYTDNEISVLIEDFFSDNFSQSPVVECSVTIRGTINVGIGSFEVSITVSGPCGECLAAAIHYFLEVKAMLSAL